MASIAITAALCGSLALSGCTKPKPPETPAPTPSASPSAKAELKIDGVPAPVSEAVAKLYLGEKVDANADTAKVLAGVKPLKELPQGAKGSAGAFDGQGIASVEIGKDATFLIEKDKKWQVVGGWWPSLGAAGPALSKDRLVLFMGSDSRRGEETKTGHADALQIMAFDGKDGGAILGIARDSWVQLPGGNYGKINAAMTTGGPKAQLDTIKHVSGLPISNYMLIGFDQFTAMVNEVGGLKITLPEAVAVQGAPLPKGPQTLEGYWALRYARERKSLPEGDFDRSRHQGDILIAGAAMAQSTGPSGLANYLNIADKFVETDMSPEQVLMWFANVYRVNLKNIDQDVCKGSFGTSADGQSIVNPTARETQLYNDLKDYRLNGK